MSYLYLPIVLWVSEDNRSLGLIQGISATFKCIFTAFYIFGFLILSNIWLSTSILIFVILFLSSGILSFESAALFASEFALSLINFSIWLSLMTGLINDCECFVDSKIFLVLLNPIVNFWFSNWSGRRLISLFVDRNLILLESLNFLIFFGFTASIFGLLQN